MDYVPYVCMGVVLFSLVTCKKSKIEGFDTDKRYTVHQLACSLQAIKKHLQQDGDIYHFIDVKEVIKNMQDMNIVLTAFNKKKFITKTYRVKLEIPISKGKYRVLDVIENIVSYDDRYLESTSFGKPRGLYEDETIPKKTYFVSTIEDIPEYTFNEDPQIFSISPEAKIQILLVAAQQRMRLNKKRKMLIASILPEVIKMNKQNALLDASITKLKSDADIRKYMALNSIHIQDKNIHNTIGNIISDKSFKIM